jgi:ATP-dependent DNA helicase RecG
MGAVNIQNLLASGESQHVEFKSAFGKEAIISLSAFANASGGKVVVGVDDSGKPTGLAIGSESAQRYLNEIKNATYPQVIPHVEAFEIDGKPVLVFTIHEYPIKPVSCKNRYYKRVKNSNHLLSLEEIVDLQQQSLNISFDAYPLQESLDSLDWPLMETFMEQVGASGRVHFGDDLLTNLTKLKLIQNGRPTLAAMLMFGNHGYSLHLGRFKAADTIIDDLVLKTPLMSALDEAMVFIKKHIALSYSFDGGLRRKERWQYPLEVLRELLLNAVVHRDYKNTSDVVIKIFDDHILFTNPGRIYGGLTIEDLKRDDYVSSIRNKLLAEAFYLTGEIEKYGTGFVRIRQQLRDNPEIGLDISEMGEFFRVDVRTIGPDGPNDLKKDFRNRENDLKNDLKNRYGLTDNQAGILRVVLQNGFVTQRQLSERIGITPKNIRNNMEKLKSKGLIERIGSRKGGRWMVKQLPGL